MRAADEVIIFLASRFIEPVHVALVQHTALPQAFFHLDQVLPHQFLVLWRAAGETGERAIVPRMEISPSEPHQADMESIESQFIEIILRRRGKVREVKGDPDIVQIDFKIPVGEYVLPCRHPPGGRRHTRSCRRLPRVLCYWLPAGGSWHKRRNHRTHRHPGCVSPTSEAL